MLQYNVCNRFIYNHPSNLNCEQHYTVRPTLLMCINQLWPEAILMGREEFPVSSDWPYVPFIYVYMFIYFMTRHKLTV